MTTDQHTPPSASPPDPANENIRYRKPTTAALILDLAPILGEAEFKTAHYLATAAETSPEHTCRASNRQIAATTGLSLSNVKQAIKNLVARGKIARRAGSPTQPSGYLVTFLDTIHMGGLAAGPPRSNRGLATGPPPPEQAGLFQAQGGLAAGPPLHPESATSSQPAELDPKNPTIETLDRVFRATARDYDKALLEKARAWLIGYRKHLNRTQQFPTPDDKIVAQFLAVADWPALEKTLQELFHQGITAGDRDAWFVYVALNRIHGIAVKTIDKRREQLRLVRKTHRQPEQTGLQFAQDLTRELASTAKALR